MERSTIRTNFIPEVAPLSVAFVGLNLQGCSSVSKNLTNEIKSQLHVEYELYRHLDAVGRAHYLLTILSSVTTTKFYVLRNSIVHSVRRENLESLIIYLFVA
jgi:hypothetical protein